MSMPFVSGVHPDTCLASVPCNSVQLVRPKRHCILLENCGEDLKTCTQFKLQNLCSSSLTISGQQFSPLQFICNSSSRSKSKAPIQFNSSQESCLSNGLKQKGYLRRNVELAYPAFPKKYSPCFLANFAERRNNGLQIVSRRSRLGVDCAGRDHLGGTTIRIGLQDAHFASKRQLQCSSLRVGAARDFLSTNGVEGGLPAVPAASPDSETGSLSESLRGFEDIPNEASESTPTPIGAGKVEAAKELEFLKKEIYSTNTEFRIDPHQVDDIPNQENGKSSRSFGHLWNRIVFGTLLGLGAGWGVLAGDWLFTSLMAATVLLGTWEYFGLVEAKALLTKESPPSLMVMRLCCAICCAIPFMTMYLGGRIAWTMVSSVAILLGVLCLQPTWPSRFQFNSLFFGLFYCGLLPSFWIKLRCCLPSSLVSSTMTTPLAKAWPAVFGGPSCWTVGMVSTFLAFSTIIAADTGAYMGGKTFGRTKLIDISPKKTREGAAAGLLSAVLVSVGLSRTFRFPPSIFSAGMLGVLVFVASLFGDLVESVLKRDAGVKDSGRLIPGHGGILDRVDSYIFTGALVYSFVRIGIPFLGF